MTLVVDASVLVSLWIDPDASQRLAADIAGHDLHAPDHLTVEAVNVVRRRFNAGLLTRGAAEVAFAGIAHAPIQPWPFSVVGARVWELGANASSYDAAYIALAEHLESPLMTRDARLARVPGVLCRVVVA